MYHFYADDGRILTPPKELEPWLKGAFPAFSKLLGHLRFYYVADEIWDGRASLVFKADAEQLAAIALADGAFTVRAADEDFPIADETMLDAVFAALRKTVPSSRRRPLEQHTVNLNDTGEYHCGHRCDMCLGSKQYNESHPQGHEKFCYMNWVCYHGCVPNVNVERNDGGVFVCPGCETFRKQHNCRKFYCPEEKGHANCVECGEYHACDVHRGSHYPGQCNLGLTAEEVTSLVIPYNVKERLDTWRNG